MEPKQRQRRSFDRDFKRQAIRLVLEDGEAAALSSVTLGLAKGLYTSGSAKAKMILTTAFQVKAT